MSSRSQVPWIEDASHEVKPRLVAVRGGCVALPLVVEVEVNSRCNRRCSYCPVSLNPTPDVPKMMAKPIYERLLSQLSDWDFAGRLSYHFYNEPLLRRDLEEWISLASNRLPASRQVLYTNGDLLTDSRYESLLKAGLHWVVVTRHDSDRFPERPRQTVLIPEQLQLTNRGGTFSTPAETSSLPCLAPTEMLIVTVSGNVVLCYEDAQRAHVYGNILQRPLMDIWTDAEFVAVRERLARGHRRQASAICALCDNRAHTETGLSFYAL